MSEDSLKVTLNHASAFDHLMEKQAGMLFGNATGLSESLCVGHNLRKKRMTQKKTKRSDELIDELLAESGATPEAVFGKGGMFAMLKKRVIERALAGELIE